MLGMMTASTSDWIRLFSLAHRATPLAVQAMGAHFSLIGKTETRFKILKEPRGCLEEGGQALLLRGGAQLGEHHGNTCINGSAMLRTYCSSETA